MEGNKIHNVNHQNEQPPFLFEKTWPILKLCKVFGICPFYRAADRLVPMKSLTYLVLWQLWSLLSVGLYIGGIVGFCSQAPNTTGIECFTTFTKTIARTDTDKVTNYFTLAALISAHYLMVWSNFIMAKNLPKYQNYVESLELTHEIDDNDKNLVISYIFSSKWYDFPLLSHNISIAAINRPFNIVYCVISPLDVKRAPQSRH
jgi:hypothetical protein